MADTQTPAEKPTEAQAPSTEKAEATPAEHKVDAKVAQSESDPGYLQPKPELGDSCQVCKEKFSIFSLKFRHHCRHCGGSFCSDHSSKTIRIPKFNLFTPQRVCDSCYDVVEKEKKWQQHPDTLVPAWDQYYAVTAPDACYEPRLSKTGLASRSPLTVMQVFKQAKDNHPKHAALRVEREGVWKEWTYEQYYEDTIAAAKAMIQFGVKQFDSVNIIGFNAPEWHMANMAAIAIGGKAAGIYGTNEPDACKYITEHSGAKIVVVENKKQLDKFLTFRDEVDLKALVIYDGKVPEGANVPGKTPVLTWADFVKKGREADEAVAKELEARIAAQKPGHCCTLIYTSGTTGPPKAVMASHDSLTWITQSFLSIAPEMGDGKDPEGESVVSYLPLSHIAAQILDIHMPLILAALRNSKVTVTFARPDALKGTIKNTLTTAKPTVFFGVPRVWEKFAEALKAAGANTTGIKAQISGWAKELGKTHYNDTEYSKGGSVDNTPWGYSVAKGLVYDKVRAAFGFDRTKYFFTGAAPISVSTLEFWGALDIPVLELYGMSENMGPQNVSLPNFRISGSCGRALPGCEIMIDHVDGRDKKDEGEICFRGRHIMMGYMKNPEKTREAIDPQGFMHSGDVGRIDENGFLYITGRIKELIITAGGENIAPVPVEDKLKQACPAISSCMMVGDKRKYNTMLITLHHEIKDDVMTENLTGPSLTVNPEVKTVTAAQTDKAWHDYLTQGIAAVNKQSVSNASKVQYFRILPRDFSVPDGTLTETQKLKRPVVVEKYQALIDDMYKPQKEEGKAAGDSTAA